MKTIAFVSQPWVAEVPPTRDSIGLIVHQLASRLVGQADVIVYSKGNHERGVIEKVADGVRYRQVPCRPDFDSVLQRVFRRLPWRRPKLPWFASMLYQIGYAVAVALDARRQGCDVIHVMNFTQFIPVMKLLNPRRQVGLHMECDWLTALDRSTMRQRLRFADVVIGCSEYISHTAAVAFPAIARRVQTVWNGIDLNRFSVQPIEQDATSILYVGRVSPEKGVHVLVQAFALVAARHPTARLVLVGPVNSCDIEFIVRLSDDPVIHGLERFYTPAGYLAEMRATVPADVWERIDFVGPVDNTKMAQYYRQAAVFAFPSVCNEAFGIPVVEALASGRPVVGARAGGITEILEGADCGILVPRDDAPAMSEAVLELLESPARRSLLVASARQHAAERFTWDRSAARLAEIYGIAAPPVNAPRHVTAWIHS